ncbi:MAG: glycosyltransferase family 2 protein [Actinomycetota bacterium]|nr:glycosyltransferase family 2 protein [Actinomycetota bacterium]
MVDEHRVEPTSPSVTVVLPARDEAGALPGVLQRIPAGYQVVVVDNASTDDTAAVARRHGAAVVFEANPGYGAAVHAGLLAADTDIVCFLDADGSIDPEQLPAMVALLEATPAYAESTHGPDSSPEGGGLDLIVGRRRVTARGAWAWHARAGNAVLAARLRSRTGIPIHDLGPVRVARRLALLELGVEDRRFGYPIELLVRAARAGWQVREVDVDYAPRTAGRSKVTGSIAGTARALRDFAAAMP